MAHWPRGATCTSAPRGQCAMPLAVRSSEGLGLDSGLRLGVGEKEIWHCSAGGALDGTKLSPDVHSSYGRGRHAWSDRTVCTRPRADPGEPPAGGRAACRSRWRTLASSSKVARAFRRRLSSGLDARRPSEVRERGDPAARRPSERGGCSARLQGTAATAPEGELEAAKKRKDCSLGIRGLTFELRGERRRGAWPAGRMMYHTGRRAKCHAGASPLERRVRPHRVTLLDLDAACSASMR